MMQQLAMGLRQASNPQGYLQGIIGNLDPNQQQIINRALQMTSSQNPMDVASNLAQEMGVNLDDVKRSILPN